MNPGVDRTLGQSHIARCFDEFPELSVRHLMTIDPKPVDARKVRKALLRLMLIGAHRKGAPWNELHSCGLASFGGEAGISGAASDFGFWLTLFRDACRRHADHGTGKHRTCPY